jgi:PAS domain S-box-containing protein
MDEQVITQYVAQIISGVGGLALLVFRYKELLGFLYKASFACWKPLKWVLTLIKMPIELNKEAVAARERMGKVESVLNDLDKFIKKELTFNGGSSTRDMILRIENRIIEQEYAQNALLLDSEHGIFRTDLEGHNKWVNRTFARLLGCGTNELLSYGWKRFIKTHELSRYNLVWKAAFEDGCEFDDIVEFTDASGDVINLKVSACPIIDDRGKVLSYVGTVVPV